jgi:hypothetical protein
LLSYIHNDYSVDENRITTFNNNDMTSSMSSIIRYHLLAGDFNESEMLKQEHDIENSEYLSFSSSAPAIIYTDDLTDIPNR